MNKNDKAKAEEFISFINKSPSVFHFVSNIEQLLLEQGFTRLYEDKPFNLKRGKSYYVIRNSSAIVAFKIPTSFDAIHIAAAHTDSPTFRIKSNPEVKKDGLPVRLNVEKYGGLLLYPWFDRPLSIAGRIFIKKSDFSVEERMLDLAPLKVVIPNLAIHQNREANDGWKISIQKEMLPLFRSAESTSTFEKALAEKAKLKDNEEILDYDLYLYPKLDGFLYGADDEFLASSKIDDAECAYLAIKALLASDPKNKIAMAALFDNEEVGSGTKQGALSDLLVGLIERIYDNLNINSEERAIIKASSRMLSADNGHAVHPAYPEKSDITNKPKLNGGVVVKYSANQKYTTDGESGAFVKALMKKNNIKYQEFYNNSDVLGGSTLGNLSTQQLSLKTCDIGLAELAMHSPLETAGVEDLKELENLFKSFFNL